MSESEVIKKAQAAKTASGKLAVSSSKVKNYALERLAEGLQKNAKFIIDANSVDLEAGEKKELSRALLDRLSLDGRRIQEMIDGLLIVKNLADPVGEVRSDWIRPNGLRIKKVRVPLGVIGIIYEARPNVTVDSAALCLKSGNAVVLRGSATALNSNIALVKVLKDSADKAGLPGGCIQLIEDTSHESAEELMTLRQYIDVLIPRGGKDLIQTVVQKAKIPTIETGEGNCHAYVEKTANLKMAVEIVVNAKCQRPSVCNALETLLVDEAIAEKFIPLVFEPLKERKVELRGDDKVLKIDSSIKPAKEADWSTEFLSMILAVKVVKGVEEAIEHINKYGTRHSETIISKDKKAVKQFFDYVDSAALYHNASTRFTDGGEFGFGAEIGISTQKLHARGPLGLPELTSYKYLVVGRGQVRY